MLRMHTPCTALLPCGSGRGRAWHVTWRLKHNVPSERTCSAHCSSFVVSRTWDARLLLEAKQTEKNGPNVRRDVQATTLGGPQPQDAAMLSLNLVHENYRYRVSYGTKTTVTVYRTAVQQSHHSGHAHIGIRKILIPVIFAYDIFEDGSILHAHMYLVDYSILRTPDMWKPK